MTQIIVTFLLLAVVVFFVGVIWKRLRRQPNEQRCGNCFHWIEHKPDSPGYGRCGNAGNRNHVGQDKSEHDKACKEDEWTRIVPTSGEQGVKAKQPSLTERAIIMIEGMQQGPEWFSEDRAAVCLLRNTAKEWVELRAAAKEVFKWNDRYYKICHSYGPEGDKVRQSFEEAYQRINTAVDALDAALKYQFSVLSDGCR